MIEFVKKHSHGIVTTITILVLISFSYQVMAYLIGLKKEPESRPPRIPVRSVVAEKVSYDTLQSPVVADGRVVSTEEVVISSEIRGKILLGDIPFKKGQDFRINDVLIRIFDGNAVNSLRSRKSAFLQKIAGIMPDLKVDFPDSYKRWMSFFQAVELDNSLPELPNTASEQEKIFVASRNILTDYYSIKSDEITLSKHIIHAPFDGSFKDVLIEVGAIANTGATLARVIRTDRFELEATVKVSETKWIEIGDIVDIIDENGAVGWTGKVMRKSSYVEANTQTLSVFVRFAPSRDKPLYEGQYLRAVFPGKAINNVMEIPRKAVFNFDEVFTVEDGKLTKHKIKIHKLHETTLLFSGLSEGAVVVTEPLTNAMENTKVSVDR
jgi:membrane fusion protein, multidrug efflux system